MPKRRKTAGNPVPSGNAERESAPPDADDNDGSAAKRQKENGTGERVVFTCKECGRNFQYAKGLARHFRDFHTGAAAHEQAPFRRVPRRPAPTAPPAPKPVACPACGRVFQSEQLMKVHSDRQHGDTLQNLREWKQKRREETRAMHREVEIPARTPTPDLYYSPPASPELSPLPASPSLPQWFHSPQPPPSRTPSPEPVPSSRPSLYPQPASGLEESEGTELPVPRTWTPSHRRSPSPGILQPPPETPPIRRWPEPAFGLEQEAPEEEAEEEQVAEEEVELSRFFTPPSSPLPGQREETADRDHDDATVGGLVELIEERRDENPEFHAAEKITRFIFTEKARRLGVTQADVLRIIQTVLEHLLNPAFHSPKLRNRRRWIQVALDSETGLDFPVISLYQRLDEFDLESFMDQLENVLGSQTDFGLDDQVDFVVRTIDDKGLGALLAKNEFLDPIQYIYRSQYVWDPGNDATDPECLVRSIAADVVRRADPGFRKRFWFRKPGKVPKIAFKKGSKGHVSTKAFWATVEKIYHGTGLSRHARIRSDQFPVIQKFLNRHFGGLQLVIYDRKAADKVIYKGLPERNWRSQCAITVYDEHAYWVIDQRLYRQKRKVCNVCNKFYQKRHFCPKLCTKCNQINCPMALSYHAKGWAKRDRILRKTALFQRASDKDSVTVAGSASWIKCCEDCNRWFENEQCYTNHRRHQVHKRKVE